MFLTLGRKFRSHAEFRSSEIIRFHRHHQADGNGRTDRLARIRRRLFPRAEALEGRTLLTLDLASEPGLSSVVGVGFSLNPVAEILEFYNGQGDDNPSDYRAQINWGDSASWDTGVSLVALGIDGANVGHVLVKASHVYTQQGTYDITVSVSGPDGQTASDVTATATALPMPDASSEPITVPTTYKGAEPLAYENLNLESNYSVSSYVGVGFSINPVTEILGTYNGEGDNTVSDYHAQINWGDSNSWDTNVSLVEGGIDSAQIGHVFIKGSHVYKQQGTYDITVYVTGPDGQTVSDSMAAATAVPMPDASSQPITVPTAYKGAEQLGYESLNLVSNYAVSSYAGVGFSINPVAEILGTYNGEGDDAVSDYHAQINWGDSNSWDTNVSLVAGGIDSAQIGHVLIKGSHVYKQQGTYDITVYVTGPDGQTVSDAMATATAVPMPDPSSQPITVPTSYTGSQPLGDETLAFVADYSVSSYVGVGFSLNLIAKFQGMYNGQPDNAVSDYHAQVNWGDSGSWDTSASLVSLGGGDFLVKGSHTYRDQGIYDVVVYATGPDGKTASAMTATVNVSPNPVSVTLDAPAVTDSNAASEVPYSFSLVFQNSSGLISGSSVSGATVQVVPPDDEAIPATLLSTQPSGNTDGNGDASTITANYQITPSHGDWNQAPMGTYTVNLVGSPVTGTSGGQAPHGSVGTFQVNVAVKLVLEVAQYDTTVPEGGTIPIEVQALGASGSPDPGVNGPGTIQLNGKDVATVNLQNGTGTTTITAPNQSGQYQLQGYVSNLDSGSTGINVEPDEPSPGKLLSEAAEGAAGVAELLKGLLEEDLNDPNQVAEAALKQLQGLKNVLGNVIPFLNRVPLALDLYSLWKDATQPASPANQAQFQKDFSKALKDGIELDVACGTAVGLELNPIGAIGGFLLGSAIQEGVGAIYDTYLNAGAMTSAGQLYQALKGSGNTVLLTGGVQYFAGNGDPPPSIVLVNPPNASSGAENLSIAGQSAYAQAGTAFDGVVATFFDASGNTLVSAYNAYIAWGDGNFTQGTVSPLPGGGFEVTGSDTYTTPGIYSVGVVVTSTDGSSAVAYNAATVYPASPTGTTSAPVVSVLAPDVSAENADWQTPYTFSVVYQDPGMVSIASLARSSVQVKPPNGPAVTAQETGTQLLGNTDALGDATTIIATYRITPPGGNWYAAAPGNYTVTVGGLPVTDLSGSPAQQGGIGTFLVSVPPTIQVSPDVSQLGGTTISNSATLTLSGYAEAASAVEIYNGASAVGGVVARADGAWSLPYEVPENGAYNFTAIATDGAGNTSAPSDDAPVEVDTLPPMSTVAALPATSQATFNVSWSGTDDPGGSGIAFYDVYVSNDGGPFTLWQSDTVSTSASYAASAGHTYGFYSVATDYAGNVQATPAAAQAMTEVQTTAAPSQPPPPALLPADDSGTKGDGITDDASPSLIGTTQANATVQLQSGANEVVATTTAADNGNYTFAVPGAPLSPGAYTFTVVASNASGSSPASNPFTLTIVAPPPTPSAPTLLPSDTNGSPGGETTYSTSPLLVGTTLAGATVQLLNPGGAVVATTQANSAGAYTVQVPGPLAIGAHANRVQIVDQYGDKSSPSPARSITVVSRPAPPVTVTYDQDILNKKHQVTEVVVIFSGTVSATEADRTSTYRLATPGKVGSYTAKNAGVIKLKSAAYHPTVDSVTLTPAKPFTLTKPVQLVVYASGPTGLQDTHGRYINGGKSVVVFPTPGPVIHIEQSAGAGTRMVPAPAAIDALLEREELAGLRHNLRATRERRSIVT